MWKPVELETVVALFLQPVAEGSELFTGSAALGELVGVVI